MKITAEDIWKNTLDSKEECQYCSLCDREEFGDAILGCLAQSAEECPGVKEKLKEMVREGNAIQSLDAKAE